MLSERLSGVADYFEKAKKAGCKIHLIIENGSLEKIVNHEYSSKFSPNSLLSSLMAFSDRYDITYHFCEAENTSLLINKIFTHHIRNKLYKELEESEK